MVEHAGRWLSPDEELTGGTLLVVAFSTWCVADLRRLARRAEDAGAVTLPVRHDGATTVLGPLVGPGAAGCVECVETARLHTHALPGFVEPPAFTGAFTPMSRVVAEALVAEIGRDPVAAAGTVWLIDGSDATVSAHRVPPWPGCPACAERAGKADGEPAPFVPVPRPLPVPGLLRGPNELATLPRLRAHLVEPRFGPVVAVRSFPEPLPAVTASAAMAFHGDFEWGYGRSDTVEGAERIALFEAVERRLALQPFTRNGELSASFAELGPGRAVDPASLGLPDPRYDHHPASRVTPYRPDLRTRWVRGWSMTWESAVAVPANIAYYGLPSAPDAPRFVDETSNGCGLGNSLEEAVLYGLFEVAERDAFLMAWYARTPLERVELPEDERVFHLTDRLDEAGYDLLLFDATNDLGVPTVVSLALSRTDDPAKPHAYFAAGAHHDPRTALAAAAQEAAVGVLTHAVVARRSRSRERLLEMLAEPTEVRTLDDHVALHSLPEARPRYDFLLHDGDPAPWQEVWPAPRNRTADLTTVLTGTVTRWAGLGLETVVVDQTDPWTREHLGLHAAKVVVPGALPMAFGFVHQRTVGLPRLLRVPFELGRAPAVREHDELTLYPHPFG
ncbi:TOMM precursor leader peptide-binding protein [Amycolatopsis sp. NPDC004747]